MTTGIFDLTSDLVFQEIWKDRYDEDGLIFTWETYKENGLSYFVERECREGGGIWIYTIPTENIEKDIFDGWKDLRLIDKPIDFENEQDVRKLAEYIFGFIEGHIAATKY